MMRVLILLLSACSAWGQAWYPTLPDLQASNASLSTAVIDATGEKWAACGQVWTPTSGAKSIRKVGIMFGSTITKAGGSALTLSLQDESLSAGPPSQPDGTQDQTVAIPNGSIAAATFLLTGALSADRSVSFGESVCAVVEYDGAGRLGSDSIQLASLARNGGNVPTNPTSSLYTASWAANSRVPIIVFEFSDGSYGTLDGAFIFSAYNTTVAYNSGSGSDEYALKFTVPTDGTINGVMVSATLAAGADFDVVLYSGTTSMASISVDANTFDASVNGLAFLTFPPTSVTGSTEYRISIKPTTANNVTLAGVTVANNAYLQALPQGTGYIRSSRVDAGSWSDTTTIVPGIRFRFTPSAGSGVTGGSFVVAQ